MSKENFPEELVSLNKEILERRLSSNFGSFTSRGYGSTCNLRETEAISARGKIPAQVRIEDARKSGYSLEGVPPKAPQSSRARPADKIPEPQTTPAQCKKEEEKSSSQRTRSQKKLSDRNRNHLRRKIMEKANELIVKKQDLSPHILDT